MKTNKFLSWLKTWDAGEFDFTAALHDRQAELNVNNGNRDHPWKLEPVNRLKRGKSAPSASSILPLLWFCAASSSAFCC